MRTRRVESWLNAAVERLRSSPRRVWWTTFVLVTVLSGLWAIANPPYAAPDEPAHVKRAVALDHGELTGKKASPRLLRRLGNDKSSLVVRVPEAYTIPEPGCFAFYPDISAACLHGGGSTRDVETVTTAAASPACVLRSRWTGITGAHARLGDGVLDAPHRRRHNRRVRRDRDHGAATDTRPETCCDRTPCCDHAHGAVRGRHRDPECSGDRGRARALGLRARPRLADERACRQAARYCRRYLCVRAGAQSPALSIVARPHRAEHARVRESRLSPEPGAAPRGHASGLSWLAPARSHRSAGSSLSNPWTPRCSDANGSTFRTPRSCAHRSERPPVDIER